MALLYFDIFGLIEIPEHTETLEHTGNYRYTLKKVFFFCLINSFSFLEGWGGGWVGAGICGPFIYSVSYFDLCNM